MKLIDSHCHLASIEGELPMVLERAKEAGIWGIINIATSPKELEYALGISSDAPLLFHAAATTPHDVGVSGEHDFELFKLYTDRLTALGETGLDYHYERSPRDVQQHFLRKYIQLAKERRLPILFHCREAFADLFRIIDEEKYTEPALLHCFTGTLEEAREVIKRGWYLSLSGIVTFKKSEVLREVAETIPLDRLLIETDAPYLAPQIHRGKQNEPAYLIETAKCIADVRQIPLEKLAEATSENTKRFFRINNVT